MNKCFFSYISQFQNFVICYIVFSFLRFAQCNRFACRALVLRVSVQKIGGFDENATNPVDFQDLVLFSKLFYPLK
jgi:hypothetical protein